MTAHAALHCLFPPCWLRDASRRLPLVIGLTAITFGAIFNEAAGQERPVADEGAMRFKINGEVMAIESSPDQRFALTARVSTNAQRQSGDGRFQLTIASAPSADCGLGDPLFANGFELP